MLRAARGAAQQPVVEVQAVDVDDSLHTNSETAKPPCGGLLGGTLAPTTQNASAWDEPIGRVVSK
jgi:hypothetical protein